jgi:mRNA interferase MazF
VRYPFTDLTAVKVRPAVILTPDRLISRLDDVLCLFVSSSVPAELLPTDFVLEPTHPAFFQTGLRFRSIFRCHKLALLHKSLVLRVLGEVDDELMDEINLRLQVALGLGDISGF